MWRNRSSVKTKTLVSAFLGGAYKLSNDGARDVLLFKSMVSKSLVVGAICTCAANYSISLVFNHQDMKVCSHSVFKWVGMYMEWLVANECLEHVSEVRINIRAVLDRLQTVFPCSHPNTFEKVVDWLATLPYMPHGRCAVLPFSKLNKMFFWILWSRKYFVR